MVPDASGNLPFDFASCHHRILAVQTQRPCRLHRLRYKGRSRQDLIDLGVAFLRQKRGDETVQGGQLRILGEQQRFIQLAFEAAQKRRCVPHLDLGLGEQGGGCGDGSAIKHGPEQAEERGVLHRILGPRCCRIATVTRPERIVLGLKGGTMHQGEQRSNAEEKGTKQDIAQLLRRKTTHHV